MAFPDFASNPAFCNESGTCKRGGDWSRQTMELICLDYYAYAWIISFPGTIKG